MVVGASAADITVAVKGGRTTAGEVVRDHLDRVAASSLNAFTHVSLDRSLARAAAIDARIRDGEDPGPLAGVPIGLKDLIDQAGEVTTCGSGFYRHRPTKSATVVDRLERAGAVIVGRTGLHEFAYGFSSENHWFGPVLNPWDPATSPGGSSGGSAAAVAASLAAVAVGTDTGGSVRVPAALTGTFGLKVTHGRVPLTGVFPLAASVDTVGPICRTSADLALAFDVMKGHDPSDPWSLPDRQPPSAPTPRTIGVPTEWLAGAPLDPTVAAAFSQTLDRLADWGADVVEVNAPTLEPWGHLNVLMGAQAARVHREWLGDPSKVYGPEVAERLDLALDLTGDDLVDALEWQSALKVAAETVFSEVDVLVTPAVGATRKVIGDPLITVRGVDHPYRTVLAYFASLVNHMGTPAVVAPLTGGSGLPHSVQFIGPWGHERQLLDLLATLEASEVVGFRAPPTSI